VVDGLVEIEDLVDVGERGPGTDAERRAAVHLAGRLEELGREADVEPISIWPGWPLAHALHASIAVLGSALAVPLPPVGFGLVALATIAALADLMGSPPLLRRLAGRRASQNVTSREDAGKRGTLILMAHYDAGRTGAVYGRLKERRAAISHRIRRPIGPFRPYIWALLAVLAASALRLAGLGGTAVSIVQFVPTVGLIVCVPLFLDIALSGIVPGAGDNASGVATVLRLADRYGGMLDYFDLWVVLPGAGEALQSGTRQWLRRHRRELNRRTTIVLNVDTVGAGTVRYLTKEGPVLSYGYHPRLVALCDQIREEDDEDDEPRYLAKRIRSRGTSDAHAARLSSLPAISISCLGALDYSPDSHRPTDTVERVDHRALERAYGFCSELIELIDEEIGPDLPEAAELSESKG
jgi:hypothetical protein